MAKGTAMVSAGADADAAVGARTLPLRLTTRAMSSYGFASRVGRR